MGYAETRLQREIQQLKRQFVKTKEREQQTRQGCMELARAFKEMAASVENSATPASPRTSELLAQAGVLLAPDGDEM